VAPGRSVPQSGSWSRPPCAREPVRPYAGAGGVLVVVLHLGGPSSRPNFPDPGCRTPRLCSPRLQCVSHPSPRQNSEETVYGRFLVNGQGVAGVPRDTIWHDQTTTSGCSGTTDASGTARGRRSMSPATLGYTLSPSVSSSPTADRRTPLGLASHRSNTARGLQSTHATV
jgi:hypothetical protein